MLEHWPISGLGWFLRTVLFSDWCSAQIMQHIGKNGMYNSSTPGANNVPVTSSNVSLRQVPLKYISKKK